MPNSFVSYLQEMGIQSWELTHPERLQGYEPQFTTLPQECVLLLVSPIEPSFAEKTLFEKVLKSFHLNIEQACFIYPHQLNQINVQGLDWIWFAGCDEVTTIVPKQLVSPRLADIEGNNQHRRELWQQILAQKDA